ncbi:MAG: Uma2 family endonuclease [Planctomycetes bacterium]|nr:Uma2 family endonuclease [Planctomycetota bacterium]
MASVSRRSRKKSIEYPSGDGRPIAETPTHRINLTDLIQMLERWFAKDDMVYISGNMFVYYVEGAPNKRLSPDVFMVRGVPRDKERDYYLIWEEGKGPDVVFELTSRSTKEEDLEDKFRLYQDVLKVQEYFLFDPKAEYLKPSLQGFRLHRGRYVPIPRIKRRLPSKVLGLHLVRQGARLRLYDPATCKWLLTYREAVAEIRANIQRLEGEIKRIRRKTKELRRRASQNP